MFEAQIKRILTKAEMIGLDLGTTIEERQLHEFEQKYSIKLPDSYKAYLVNIQNGIKSYQLHAKGPYYGIYSIQESLAEAVEWELDLASPFPVDDDLDFGELYNRDPDRDKHKWRCENDEAYISNIEKVLEKYQTTAMLDGTIPICDYGGGDIFRLVLTGKRPGDIWVDSGIINDTGFYNLKVDILTFFEHWLDRKIAIKEGKSKRLINAWYSFLEFGNNKRYKIAKEEKT